MRFVQLILLSVISVAAQSVVADGSRLPSRIRFEAQPGELPLRCEITPIKPTLNYGFRFQAGYVVTIPLIQYSGKGNRLMILSRVTPKGGKPVFFAQGLLLPEIPPDAPTNKQQIDTGGNYLMGEGQYDVDWLLVDNQRRVCRKKWTSIAELKGSSKKVKPAIPSNTVTDLSLRGVPLPTPEDEDVRKLNLTVLMHATPMSSRRNVFRPSDEAMLLGTLSALMGRIPTASVRLVIFNLEQHREIFRRNGFQLSDLDDASEALQKVDLTAINYSVLKNKAGHIDLLADLVNQEQNPEAPNQKPSDVVIFLGPMARHLDKPPDDVIEPPRGILPRFFYFRFESFVRRNPNAGLPDAINFAVKKVKGKSVIIHTPIEFSKAIEQVMAKVNQS